MIEGLFVYIAETLLVPGAAKNSMAEIDTTVFSLSEFPARYAMLPEAAFAQREYRKVEVGNYLIYYRITEEVVEILRVLYSGQDYFKLLR